MRFPRLRSNKTSTTSPDTKSAEVEVTPKQMSDFLDSMEKQGWKVTKDETGGITLTNKEGQTINLTPEPDARGAPSS